MSKERTQYNNANNNYNNLNDNAKFASFIKHFAKQLKSFYFLGLHPVAFVTKTLLWWPSIVTKFFYLFPLSLTSLHVSAHAGHLQANTIVFSESYYLYCLLPK
jgi:hypothetical protein